MTNGPTTLVASRRLFTLRHYLPDIYLPPSIVPAVILLQQFKVHRFSTEKLYPQMVSPDGEQPQYAGSSTQ